MSDTTVASALELSQWSKGFFKEYVRNSRFYRYMGTDENKVIQYIEDLTKKKGENVTMALVTRLTGNGVTGDNTLEGNEEALGNYGHQITVDQLRNAISIGNHEARKSQIDMLAAGRVMLKLWCMEDLRDNIIRAMQSANVNGTTAYASCSEAQKDAWAVANSDRLLFGAAVANYSGDHSTDLANVDSSTDTLSASMVSLAKRKAMTADPHIRPIIVKEDEEWFVMFCNSLAFRDLKNDSTITQANREGWTRGKDNPLFHDGDLLWDGVICREVPEIPVISSVGAASIDVAPNFFCGAQSVAVGWAQRPTPIFDTWDFGNRHGVGIKETRGVEKCMYNDIQHGMVTVYTAGVADA